MTVLSAQSIRSNVHIEPWSERKVHESGMSYGLSVAGYDLRIKDYTVLLPGEFRLATTIERLVFPNNIQGILLDKSSWARKGLSCFNTKFEPGWYGYPTIELVNLSKEKIFIGAGAPICQMEFHWLDEPTDHAYEGKYQGQEQEPVGARHEEF